MCQYRDTAGFADLIDYLLRRNVMVSYVKSRTFHTDSKYMKDLIVDHVTGIVFNA